MTEQLQSICNKLDEISSIVLNYGIGAGYDTKTVVASIYGAYVSPLSTEQLSYIPKVIASRIRETYIGDDEPDQIVLTGVQTSLDYLATNSIQAMFSHGAQHAIPVYMTTLQYIDFIFGKSPDWQVLANRNMLPVATIRRLQSISADIEKLTPQKEELEEQIRLIREAHETADSLPVDLQRLREANEQMSVVSKQASELYGSIKDYPDLIKQEFVEIQTKNTEAKKIVEQSREAYQITTSIGLAGAFDERAKTSEDSVNLWVGALIAALGAGIWIGHERIALLTDALNKPDLNWGVISIHIVITLLSFGGPIWFAWLATKQISQRFRLAEDYAYKASIAKAYEGFRQEAARLDPKFASQLFGSTLTRLDEAPIRLFDNDTHGSPWHELFASKAFQDLLKTAPGAKDELMQLIKDKLPSYGSSDKAGKAKSPEEISSE